MGADYLLSFRAPSRLKIKLSPFRKINIGLNRARTFTAIEAGGIHSFNLGRDVMRVLKFF